MTTASTAPLFATIRLDGPHNRFIVGAFPTLDEAIHITHDHAALCHPDALGPFESRVHEEPDTGFRIVEVRTEADPTGPPLETYRVAPVEVESVVPEYAEGE